MSLYSSVFYFEVMALFSVMYFHYKQRTSKSLVLLILLISIVLFESTAIFELFPGNDLLIINSIVLVELMLYFLFFILLLQAGNKRRYVVVLACAFFFFWIINSVFFQPISTNIQTYSYILGASGVLVAILLYVYHDLLVVNRIEPLFQRYFLWICAGLFIFLATDIPIMGIVNYMIDNEIPMNEMPVFKVKSIVTILYYLTYPIGLIWMRTE